MPSKFIVCSLTSLNFTEFQSRFSSISFLNNQSRHLSDTTHDTALVLYSQNQRDQLLILSLFAKIRSNMVLCGTKRNFLAVRSVDVPRKLLLLFVSSFVGHQAAGMIPQGTSIMFDSYASTYQDSAREIRCRLNALDPGSVGSGAVGGAISNTDAITELHRLFKDAENCLHLMDMEARGMGAEKRREVKALQVELKAMSAEFDKKLVAIHRKGLLGDAGQQKAIQRRLADLNTQIQRDCANTEQAVRQAIESEEIGTQILGDLAAQRETIQRSRANMGRVGKELDQSGGHIKKIEKPECCVM